MNLAFSNVLTLGFAYGFAFGFPSPFELLNAEQNPYLNMIVRTAGTRSLYIELKGNGGGFVGEERFGFYKLRVDLPNTGGQFRMVTIPIGGQFVPSVTDRFVRQIALSDANGAMDIAALGLSASAPSYLPHVAVKAGDVGTVLFTGYGGRAEVSADLVNWQVLSDFIPPLSVVGPGRYFFRIHTTGP